MNGCDEPSSVWLNEVLDTTPSLKCSWQWCWCALLLWILNVEYIFVSNEQSLNDSELFHYSSNEYSNRQNNLTRCMSQLSHKHSTCNLLEFFSSLGEEAWECHCLYWYQEGFLPKNTQRDRYWIAKLFESYWDDRGVFVQNKHVICSVIYK